MRAAAQRSPSQPAADGELVEALLGFIAEDGCSEDEFDALAVQIFAHQFARCEPYQRFCRGRGVLPRKVRRWQDIPPVPISAFKEVTLSCAPTALCERVFMTSGTTRAEIKGRHWHPTLAVYDASMTRNFDARFMRGDARLSMAILFPDEAALPNSSLAHYLSLAAATFGSAESGWYVDPTGIDAAGLRRALDVAERRGDPFALLGATSSFVHALDAFMHDGVSFRLPAGSRILDTGGYKRHSRELALEDFYAALSRTFGVSREQCINMYGMTELSTQFYDDGNALLPSVKSGPHWIRSRTIDPLTGADVRPGERGVLVHCDLANFNSATSIVTEDVGIVVEGGFHLLGRVDGAEAKGCSLMVEEFLRTARQ